MEPPESESGPQPATRLNRVLGLTAAVGFSIAMWVFIAVAVLGLLLKVIGPKGTQEGLEAAGLAPPPPPIAGVPDDDFSKGPVGQIGSITTLGAAAAGPPAEPLTVPPKPQDGK